MNTEQYVHMMTWLQALTGLIEQMQVRRLNANICVTIPCDFRLCFFLFFLHRSSNVCTQTGTQGSSISSCRRGVDQRKRSHEVIDIITLVTRSSFDHIMIIIKTI